MGQGHGLMGPTHPHEVNGVDPKVLESNFKDFPKWNVVNSQYSIVASYGPTAPLNN